MEPNLPRSGSASPLADAVRRLIDVVVGSLALVVLAPVLLVTAVLVRVKLGSPVLFRQNRPGRGGQPFELLKFRTMLSGQAPDAERLTPFGRKLRATSLDELPELVNVVKGEMSLVGPRPLRMGYLPLYTERQARRHDVRPGLTGLAQASGRNSVDWAERLELDVQYVEQRSLRLDAKIIVATIRQLASRSGIAGDGEATMPAFTGDGTAEHEVDLSV